MPGWRSDRSSDSSRTAPTASPSRATAGARSSPRSCAPTSSRALLDGVDDALASGKPALVVAGDDRQARDLAADLRHWLAPRPVRFYPSRGVAYESHLAPPPHLVGLRVAALDALLEYARNDDAGEEPPVVVVSAVALSEKVPDPELRPHSLHAEGRRAPRPRRGRHRPRRRRLRARRPGRGPRPVRDPRRPARRLPGDRGPRDPRRPLRHRDRVAPLVLHLHPAQPGRDATASRSPPRPSSPPSTARLAEIAALEDTDNRPDVAELLPVDRFQAFLDLAPAGRGA